MPIGTAEGVKLERGEKRGRARPAASRWRSRGRPRRSAADLPALGRRVEPRAPRRRGLAIARRRVRGASPCVVPP